METLTLHDINGTNHYVFSLGPPIGYGRTCIAYDALRHNTWSDTPTSGRLKKVSPRGIDPGSTAYTRAVERFRHGFETQAQLLLNPLTNAAVTTAFSFLEDRTDNSVWLFTEYSPGKTLAEMTFRDFDQVVHVLINIVEAVAAIHHNGYLLLDLSPQNIWVNTGAGASNSISFFDFDSFITKSSLKTQNTALVHSGTGRYGAPEVSLDFFNIDERADIYSIGMILYNVLFDSFPSTSLYLEFQKIVERFRVSCMSYRSKLSHIFKKTLAASPGNRYSSTDELLDDLRLLLPKSNLFTNNLISYGPSSRFYIDRQDKNEELDNFFDNHKNETAIAIVRGEVSGVGKTSLALRYAQRHFNDYDTIQFCHYKGNYDSVIAQMSFPDSKDLGTRKTALNTVAQHILLIIDNFDEEKSLDPLPPMKNVHIIITSRYLTECFLNTSTQTIWLKTDKNLSLAIFERVYNNIAGKAMDSEQRAIAESILEMVGFHTYASNLIAQELAKTPSVAGFQKYLAHAKEKKSSLPGYNTKVTSRKDVFEGQGNKTDYVVSLVLELFADVLSSDTVTPIEQQALYIMRHLAPLMDSLKLFQLSSSIAERHGIETSIPTNGIEKITLCSLLGDTDYSLAAADALEHLLSRGWVLSSSDHRFIYLHPLALAALQLCNRYDDDPSRNLHVSINLLAAIMAGKVSLLWEYAEYAIDSLLLNRLFRRTANLIASTLMGLVHLPLLLHELATEAFWGLDAEFATEFSAGKWSNALLVSFKSADSNRNLLAIYNINEDKLVGLFEIGASYWNNDSCCMFDRVEKRLDEVLRGKEDQNSEFNQFDDDILIAQKKYNYQLYGDVLIHRGCSDGLLSIPPRISNHNISTINPWAFAYAEMTSVSLPPAITTINEGLFSECKNLTSVAIPEGIIHIGDQAFLECVSLSKIAFPCSLKNFGWGVLFCCPLLSDVYYAGTKEEFDLIKVEPGNDWLFEVTFHFNSTLPTE